MAHPSSRSDTQNSDTPNTQNPHHTEGNHGMHEEGDALWDILGKASTPEPSDFFAQNIIRQTRQLSDSSSLVPSFAEKLKAIFSLRTVTLSAATACIGILALSQFTKTQYPADASSQLAQQQAHAPLQDSTSEQAATADSEISELILQETLLAAAEDPTKFTHDEVLAMVGL